jgi:hypothetical protein
MNYKNKAMKMTNYLPKINKYYIFKHSNFKPSFPYGIHLNRSYQIV